MVAPRQVPSPTGVAYVPGLSEATRHELTRQASQLPQVIRYFDDYDEVERSIRAAEPEWRIRLNGSTSVFRVGLLETAHRDLLHVSSAEHARLDPDKQVMDAPNGYPIVGIGGCAIGQLFCTKTPALACYTCPKFMFLRDDVAVHRNALAAAQGIVREFLEAAPTGRNTPAFAQLRPTIEVMQAVIADIEEVGAERHRLSDGDLHGLDR